MGIIFRRCLSLQPEVRANQQNNQKLRDLLVKDLNNFPSHHLTKKLQQTINQMKDQYMLSQQILNQIENIVKDKHTNTQKTQDALSDELKKSCLVIQDQIMQQNKARSINFHQSNIIQQPTSPNSPNKNNIKPQTQSQSQNPSLIYQINILYQRQLDIENYSSALSLFLKWTKLFQYHLMTQKFLQPLYSRFYKQFYKIQDFNQMIHECQTFVNYLVSIYTDIYKLKYLHQTQHGFLFKNQNIYNLIMTNIFKKSKLNKFIRNIIKNTQLSKINKFTKKLDQLQNKDMEYFKIQPIFRLNQFHYLTQSTTTRINPINVNNSFGNQSLLQASENNQPYIQPYLQCIKLIKRICQHSQSPVSKLKTIVQISKSITNQIYKYYDKRHQQLPNLDPDNLTSIIMYLITRTNNPQLYLQLKITQNFTTTNCLASISGYYLNTFIVAIECILQ